MNFFLALLTLLSTYSPAFGSTPIISHGVGFGVSLEEAQNNACADAIFNSCGERKVILVPNIQEGLSACRQQAYCINNREPNLPYSEDEYVCSGSVKAICK